MCRFHFLQCQWTWLHDGTPKIDNPDPPHLINKVKEILYESTEEEMNRLYNSFKQEVVKWYPHFIAHSGMDGSWGVVGRPWDRSRYPGILGIPGCIDPRL